MQANHMEDLVTENARLRARIAELEAERTSSSQYQRIFEDTPFGIVMVGDDGKVIHANSTFLRMLGYTLQEFKEARFERYTYSMDLWREQRLVDDIYKGKRQSYDIEKRFIHRDGNLIPARLTMLRFSPYPPVKYVGIVEDITATKDSATLLHEAQTRFQSLVETVPALVFLYEDGQITYANPVTERVVGSANLDSFESLVQQVIAEERPAEADFSLHELKITDAKGETCWLALRLVEANEEFQQVLIGTALDVTEHKLAQEREEMIQRERERIQVLMEFITNFSHDVRTPLSTIKTSLFLVDRAPDEEKRRQKIDTIDSQVNYIQDQIEDILTLLRVDTEFHAGYIDLIDLINALSVNIMPVAQVKAQKLVFDLPQGRPYMKVDGILLRAALEHLLMNAIRYTPEGGKIHFKTHLDNDEIHFVIRDNGPGIPHEYQTRVFESFYRIDGSRQGGGTGMGLAIARRVAQRHGGELTLDSEPGEGCTFTLIMPLPPRHDEE